MRVFACDRSGLGTGGVERWDDAGVTGELSAGGEAIDGADLPIDDDAQGVPDAGKALEQLDGGGEGDSLPNAIFELSDLLLEAVEGLQFLGDTAAGLREKPREGTFEPSLGGADEGAAVLGGADAVLGQRGVDAVLQRGAKLGEGHPGAVKLPLVADLPWWQPDCGEAVQVEELSQTLGVELVCLN